MIRFNAAVAVLVAGLAVAQIASPGVGAAAEKPATEKVVLAGGCFWGMEAVFESLKGVSSAVAGYSGGAKSTAHYEIVSSGLTGHAESVEVTFDPSQISFDTILKVYFTVAHDPTELNRQGPDTGTQYRSAIFFTTDAQKQSAQAYVAQLEKAKVFHDKVVTQIVPLQAFYRAEDYHQHFVAKNPDYPYVVFNDRPKLDRLRSEFPDLVKGKS